MGNFETAAPQNREEEIRGRGEKEPVPPSFVSDALRISLEHRIEEIRQEMARAKWKGNQARLRTLYAELALHQRRLGFTPDELPTTALTEPHPKRTTPPLPTPEEEQLRQTGARHLQEFMKQMRGELPPAKDE